MRFFFPRPLGRLSKFVINPLTPSEMEKRAFPVSQGVFVFRGMRELVGRRKGEKWGQLWRNYTANVLWMAAERKESKSWSLYRKTVSDPCSRRECSSTGRGKLLWVQGLRCTILSCSSWHCLALCLFPDWRQKNLIHKMEAKMQLSQPSWWVSAFTAAVSRQQLTPTGNSPQQVTERADAPFWSLPCKINQLCSDKQI